MTDVATHMMNNYTWEALAYWDDTDHTGVCTYIFDEQGVQNHVCEATVLKRG